MIKKRVFKILKYAGISVFGIFALLLVIGLSLPDEDNTVEPIITPREIIAESNSETEKESEEINLEKASAEQEETELDSSSQNEINPPEEVQYVYYSVVKVVDGDTVDLNINGEITRIRLIGIDTPETVHPSKPVECFGIEASNKAKELLTGKKVGLETDDSQGTYDTFGRLLGYLILEDGTNFNHFMISEGYAYEYTYGVPYTYQAEFKQAQKSAQVLEKGLWAPGVCEVESVDTPTTPTGSQKFYVSSHYSSKFYYCESDPDWKNLSEKYLEEYPSEEALLKDFPNHTLHEPCQ